MLKTDCEFKTFLVSVNYNILGAHFELQVRRKYKLNYIVIILDPISASNN